MSVDWGVEDPGSDVPAASRDAIERVRRALDIHQDATAPVSMPAGEELQVADAVEVNTEDGRTLSCEGGVLPQDLATGYHHIQMRDGVRRLLIVTPSRCMLPTQRAYGVAAQLYAARSRVSWGIGDLADLRTLCAWAGSLGAGFVLLNPLHAPLPATPQEPSPYSPSSRRFRNPLYIDVDSVPGVEAGGVELEALREEARRLVDDRRIDRDAVHRIKTRALELLWRRQESTAALDAFMQANSGVVLYATFCALSERHGSSWRRWPEEFRHPRNAAVERFRRDNEAPVRFHAWQQLLLDSQLEQASAALPLVHDVAVGFTADGADSWEWQDLLAQDMDIGAPPDEFNASGQNWSLPPLHPGALSAHDFGPYIETLRAGFRHAGGVRLDHVMGLFRLYWIPRDTPPDRGVYVRYPSRILLDILAVESERANAFVVGEDLGTVEPGVREELARRQVLSYRLLWFEDPEWFPELSLGAVTTHDLPTIAGLWSGSDLREQRGRRLHANEDATRRTLDRVRAHAGLGEDASMPEVVVHVEEQLARAPSLLLAAALEDLCCVRERPNLPGTGRERDNWSLALPLPLESLITAPLPARVCGALSRG